MNIRRVAIVGGGPGGLMTAHARQCIERFAHNQQFKMTAVAIQGQVLYRQFGAQRRFNIFKTNHDSSIRNAACNHVPTIQNRTNQ